MPKVIYISAVFNTHAGSLWSWGRGLNGRTGHFNTTDYSSPVQVGSAVDWKQIEARIVSSFAIKTDGTLWGWGLGVKGDGSTGSRSSPVQIGTESDWTDIAPTLFANSLVGIRGGMAWAASPSNTFGELGQGNFTASASFIQIGTKTDWVKCASGADNFFLINTSGELWGVGNNVFGQLGIGISGIDHLTQSISWLTQVGTHSDWIDVAAVNGSVAGIRSIDGIRGDLYQWGNVKYSSDSTHWRVSPVQVGSLGDWLHVYANENSFAGLLDPSHTGTRGELYAWYFVNYADLSSNTTEAPEQVGILGDWEQVGVGVDHIAAIRTGELYAWGTNNIGQLGLGDTTARSSPVQVGTDTDWTMVTAGESYTMALKE